MLSERRQRRPPSQGIRNRTDYNDGDGSMDGLTSSSDSPPDTTTPHFAAIQSHRDAVFALPARAKILAINARAPIQRSASMSVFSECSFTPRWTAESSVGSGWSGAKKFVAKPTSISMRRSIRRKTMLLAFFTILFRSSDDLDLCLSDSDSPWPWRHA